MVWAESEAFAVFASSAGSDGLVELGVDGRGYYCVRENGKSQHFKSAKEAIEAYKRFLS